jgi:cytochrome c oxidase subunit 2
MPRRTFIPTVAGALVATAIGIFIGLGVINWFPPQASIQAHNTDKLFYVLVIASVPIFVLVVTVILYSVWQFRMRPGQEQQDGPPIHGNTQLEFIWTVVPAILILGLVSYSFVILHDNEKKPPGLELQVGVTGAQFSWTFSYPPATPGGKPVTSTTLYLPNNQSVRFNMVSRDVIHAFWIPAFRLQEDVVPGITTHYRATPDRIGRYPIVCNLLCGLGHSTMRANLIVMPQSQFTAWLTKQQASVARGATTPGASQVAPAATPPAAAAASIGRSNVTNFVAGGGG